MLCFIKGFSEATFFHRTKIVDQSQNQTDALVFVPDAMKHNMWGTASYLCPSVDAVLKHSKRVTAFHTNSQCRQSLLCIAHVHNKYFQLQTVFTQCFIMSALECYLITNAPIVLDNYPIIPCVFFIVVIIPGR